MAPPLSAEGTVRIFNETQHNIAECNETEEDQSQNHKKLQQTVNNYMPSN